MNYLVGGFCFGLNFWIVVPSGGKLWGNFGWAETVSQEDSGDRADGINRKTVSLGPWLLPPRGAAQIFNRLFRAEAEAAPWRLLSERASWGAGLGAACCPHTKCAGLPDGGRGSGERKLHAPGSLAVSSESLPPGPTGGPSPYQGLFIIFFFSF